MRILIATMFLAFTVNAAASTQSIVAEVEATDVDQTAACTNAQRTAAEQLDFDCSFFALGNPYFLTDLFHYPCECTEGSGLWTCLLTSKATCNIQEE